MKQLRALGRKASAAGNFRWGGLGAYRDGHLLVFRTGGPDGRAVGPVGIHKIPLGTFASDRQECLQDGCAVTTQTVQAALKGRQPSRWAASAYRLTARAENYRKTDCFRLAFRHDRRRRF